ncbi:MAG: hypothetical protein ACLVHV_09315 [Oscillospiraceae bacterium]
MEDFKLTVERIAAYGRYLKQEERTPATLEKYLRNVRASLPAGWMGPV